MNEHIRNLLDENGPELTREEEQEVFREYKNNPTLEIKSMIGMKYYGMIVDIANTIRNCPGEIGDWINDGYLGLMDAIEKFDPDTEACFYTYAYKWVKHRILRESNRTRGPLRLPDYINDQIRHIEKASSEYIEENGHKPDIMYIIESTGLSEEDIKITWDAMEMREEESMDKLVEDPFDDTDMPTSLDELLVDPNAGIPFEEAEINADIDNIIDFIKPIVSDREYLVLAYRFGFEGCEVHTLEEIGNALKITRDGVRAIEKTALRKILRESRKRAQ